MSDLGVNPLRSHDDYHLVESENWAAFLRHLDYNVGFAFVVLLVPDKVGLRICQEALHEHLAKEGLAVAEVSSPSPDRLQGLVEVLLQLVPGPEIGAVWTEVTVPEISPDFDEWKKALEEAFLRLNPHRNRLQGQIPCTWVFAGPSWIQPIVREAAPDIWSVRSMVVRVEPQGKGYIEEERWPESSSIEIAENAPDPEFSLAEAARLRGKPGQELTLARVLFRAGVGLLGERQFESAYKAFQESLDLKTRFQAPGLDLAQTYLNLAGAVSELGLYQQAVAYLEQAVTISRQSVGAREGGALPFLSAALNNLGNAYGRLGLNEKALLAMEEAVQTRRNMAASEPTAFLPQLAMSLNNLGSRYGALGRYVDALSTSLEALAIRRYLAAQFPETEMPALALSLGNLGNRYSALGRHEEALAAAQEAVTIWRTLSASRSTDVLLNLARSLSVLADTFHASGNDEGARAAGEESLNLYRQLTKANPGDLSRNLALLLSNLGMTYLRLGNLTQARLVTEESISLIRQHLHTRPLALLPLLAKCLSNLSNICGVSGQHEEALSASIEAVSIIKSLSHQHPGGFLPELAETLIVAGLSYRNVERFEEAITATEAAISDYRQLADANPGAFLPELARAYGSLAEVLTGAGRREEATAALLEGIRHLLPRFRQAPQPYTRLMRTLFEDYLAAAAAARLEPNGELVKELGPVLQMPNAG
jgi:tetratricopeptide (TPR) repeat protein